MRKGSWMDNDLLNEMAGDAEEIVKKASSNEDNLKILSEYVQKQIKLEEEMNEAERIFEEKKELFRKMSQETIPTYFDSLGISEMKLDSGRKVTVKPECSVSVSEERKPAAFKWLRDNGFDGILKHEISVKLKKGESDEQKAVIKYLNEKGMTYEDKEAVHPQTLKAFVKEQLASEKGKNFPRETFGVFEFKKTIIK